MIIVKLMGGLGNQMFQYALGRRLSLLRNTVLKADVTFLNDTSFSHTIRKFELSVFEAEFPIAADRELNKFTSIQKSKFKKGIQLLAPFIFPYHTVGEPGHEYIPAILKSPKNSLLVGFWQTEKYFLPIQEIIRKDFRFKRPLEGINQNLAEQIANTNSVGIHIRRGDYVNNSDANLVHGVCTPAYYYSALELIKKKVEKIQTFIFSDDIPWVQSSMSFDVPVTYIDHNTGENSYIDMQLMSLCKHNIIANSSFSWWGAWLNNNPDKIVVSPAKFFQDNSINESDIIPEGWHKL